MEIDNKVSQKEDLDHEFELENTQNLSMNNDLKMDANRETETGANKPETYIQRVHATVSFKGSEQKLTDVNVEVRTISVGTSKVE